MNMLFDTAMQVQAAVPSMNDALSLRPYQQATLDGIEAKFKESHSTMFVLPTGTGKCLGAGTPVMLYSGFVVPVELVRVGDFLMGPDSKPRTVLSVCEGREALYRVTPVKGDSYVVNESHILSLKRTPSGHKYPSDKGGGIVNVAVKDYVAKSKTWKHLHKGWRCGVEFAERAVPLPLDPYFLGLWLGDGTSRSTGITTGDSEIVEYVKRYADRLGMEWRTSPNSENSIQIAITDVVHRGRGGQFIMNALRQEDLILNKHVPHNFKTGSRADRAELLAGIIDTDGCLAGGCFDLTLKSERLMDDVIFVARSLGLACYKSACKKTCSNGVVGDYFRCNISGDIDQVPCLVTRKKAGSRNQKKDVLVTGITVESIGVGDYFGFEIAGNDHLFLLGDFTVTHNTVVFANRVKQEEGRVLVLAHQGQLLRQAADKIHRVAGVRAEVEQADAWADPKAKVIVSTWQSQHSIRPKGRRRDRFDPADFSLVIADECVTGDATVETAEGPKTLKQVIESRCCTVLTYDDGRLKIGRVTAWLDRGIKPIVAVETQDGRRVKCTANHQFWTQRGWVEAGNLTRADFVLVDAEHSYPSMQSGDINRGGYLGIKSKRERRRNGGSFIKGRYQNYPCVNADVDARSICSRQPLKSSLPIDATDTDHSFAGIAADQNAGIGPFQATSEAQFWERFSVIHPLGIRTDDLPRRELRSIIPSSNRRGQDTRRGFSPRFNQPNGLSKTTGLEHRTSALQLSAIPTCEMYTASLSTMEKRRLRQHGSIRLENEGLRGGLEMTGLGRSEHSPFFSTRKDIQKRKTGSSLIGLQECMGQQRPSEQNAGTGSLVCPALLEESSSRCAPNTFQKKCNTRWIEVESVVSVGTDRVYDLTVEGSHCFFANGLLVHNCHHVAAETFRATIEHYRQNTDCRILGCTATPDRADERALGQIFQTVAYEYWVHDAIPDGWLTPIRQTMVEIGDLDYSSVRTVGNDLNQGDVQAILDREQMVHKMCAPLVELAKGRKTLVFCVTVSHAEKCAEILNRWRPESARVISQKTDADERQIIFNDYRTGKFQYLCGVMVMTEGFDDPGVEVVAMFRPTKSRALYSQMVGRALRPLESIASLLNHEKDAKSRAAMIVASPKPFAEIVDFVGNSGKHKLCSVVDILGGKYDEDLVDAARDEIIHTADGKPADVAAILAKAKASREKKKEEERLKQLAEADRLRDVKARASYFTRSLDPFDVLAIEPTARHGWDEPSTPDQIERLSKRGIAKPETYSKAQAAQLIGKLVARQKFGWCTFKQAKVLRRAGFDPSGIKFEHASQIIDKLANNNWRVTPEIKAMGDSKHPLVIHPTKSEHHPAAPPQPATPAPQSALPAPTFDLSNVPW